MSTVQGTVVVKIGGSMLGQHDTTLDDLVDLQRREVPVVVVHGGGKTISDWQKRQQLETRFVDGLRVTDAESLSVAVAVLAGVVNKELVASIAARGGRALGLSGADGGLIQARVRDPRLGFVGEVERVDCRLLDAALAAGYLPLVSPIGLGPAGQLLNINGDTVAGEMAVALGAHTLVFLTDVPGIVGKEGRVLERLDVAEARELQTNGIVSGGMIPKVKACLRALTSVGAAQIVDGRLPHALIECLDGRARGTTIAAGATVRN